MSKILYTEDGKQIQDPYLDENNVPANFPHEPSWAELGHHLHLKWSSFWRKSSIRKFLKYTLPSEIFILLFVKPSGMMAPNSTAKRVCAIRTDVDLMFALDEIEAEVDACRYRIFIGCPRNWS